MLTDRTLWKVERIHPVGRKGKTIGSRLRDLLLVRTPEALEPPCSECDQWTLEARWPSGAWEVRAVPAQVWKCSKLLLQP